jgi:hypothetical protein
MSPLIYGEARTTCLRSERLLPIIGLGPHDRGGKTRSNGRSKVLPKMSLIWMYTYMSPPTGSYCGLETSKFVYLHASSPRGGLVCDVCSFDERDLNEVVEGSQSSRDRDATGLRGNTTCNPVSGSMMSADLLDFAQIPTLQQRNSVSIQCIPFADR